MLLKYEKKGNVNRNVKSLAMEIINGQKKENRKTFDNP